MLEALAAVEAVTMEVAAVVVEPVTDQAPSNAARLVVVVVEAVAVDTEEAPHTEVVVVVEAAVWATEVVPVDTRVFNYLECSLSKYT